MNRTTGGLPCSGKKIYEKVCRKLVRWGIFHECYRCGKSFSGAWTVNLKRNGISRFFLCNKVLHGCFSGDVGCVDFGNDITFLNTCGRDTVVADRNNAVALR